MIKLCNPLLRIKFAYGYDVSGEVNEGGGTSGKDNALSDLGSPDKQHMTPSNPANVMLDSEAEKEFPELIQKKEERVIWPPRGR